MATNGSGVGGFSGRNYDAFVNSQRTFSDTDWAAKIQEKYWRARQKFLSKIEKKEDSCIVLSDSKLDAKLQIYDSIAKSCSRLTSILENYQNSLFVFANEENALGILLKECGKVDKTKAGKIMSITGKSLKESSHQRIKLYMPLMRLYQEMETFHSRAVEDTSETVGKLEDKRAKYRASLLWMKNISEKLNPDVYEQLDKFRKVQNQVREDKRVFDGMQMDVVQKIDLLMASRCNLLNQILAPYQALLLETFERNCNNFRSVEELIRKEDLYEYEFQALKQLNPPRLDDDPRPTPLSSPSSAIQPAGGGGGGQFQERTSTDDQSLAAATDADPSSTGVGDLLDLDESDGGQLRQVTLTSENLSRIQAMLEDQDDNNNNNNKNDDNIIDSDDVKEKPSSSQEGAETLIDLTDDLLDDIESDINRLKI